MDRVPVATRDRDDASTMIEIRRAGERGRTRIDWLDSQHTFSFGDYQDPRHMGFGALRVINDDRVKPASGFGKHSHRDMEIVTFVLEGALEHEDSLGNGSTIRPGDVQRMSAGTGVLHSEWNHSADEAVHFLQIWIVPERCGIPPEYEQRTFGDAELADRLRLIGSRDGRDGSVTIHQDVALHAARLSAGRSVAHELPAGRRAWVQVARGTIHVEGLTLDAGDGAALTGIPRVELVARADAELLLFDLA